MPEIRYPADKPVSQAGRVCLEWLTIRIFIGKNNFANLRKIRRTTVPGSRAFVLFLTRDLSWFKGWPFEKESSRDKDQEQEKMERNAEN